jgi:hypothetical protein
MKMPDQFDLNGNRRLIASEEMLENPFIRED